jgi:hypothetical protein
MSGIRILNKSMYISFPPGLYQTNRPGSTGHVNSSQLLAHLADSIKNIFCLNKNTATKVQSVSSFLKS